MLPFLDLIVLVFLFPFLLPLFKIHEGLQIDLPQSDFRMQRVVNPLVITVDRGVQGYVVWIDQIQIATEDFERTLLEYQTRWSGLGSMPILLRIDEDVSSGQQIQLVSRLKSVGFEKIFLATKTSSQ